MVWFAIINLTVLAALLAGQAALVVGYARKLWHVGPMAADDSQCRPAAVVFCVRGHDPSLEHAVGAVLNLDYPDYEVHFVFDSVEDPAYALVEGMVGQAKNCRATIQNVTSITGNASLKCEALTQVVRSLSDRPEIIAFVDADTIVTPTWLRELVRPFDDHQVGATTGIRWYESPGSEIGSVVRAMWNTAAIVQMYWYRIGWGGSLAIRRNAMLDTQLLERWSSAFCEDTLVQDELSQVGLRLEYIPSLHMVNTERCRLADCFHWVSRQLLTTRLYHGAWRLVAAHGLGTSLVLATSLCCVMLSVWLSDFSAFAIMFSGLLAYECGSLILLLAINWTARRILRRANRPVEKWGGEMGILYVLALPVTQALYGIACVRALFQKKVEWRGIDYRIGPGSQIKMGTYQPFRPSPSSRKSRQHSL